jgi:hypothetical protein
VKESRDFKGQTDSISMIEDYSFAQVREKLLKEARLAPSIIDQAIEEFRKYLKLVALGHRSIGMNSREVDEVWHTFILFTRDYMSFCDRVYGSYLHHQPSIPSQPLGSEPAQLFIEAYRQEFGEPPAIWAANVNADCSPDTGGGGNECCPDPSCSGEPAPSAS